MHRRVLRYTISALILAFGAAGAMAQERATPQPDQQQLQSPPVDRDTGAGGTGDMQRGMMGGGMMGGGMMGRGMMGPGTVGQGTMGQGMMGRRGMMGGGAMGGCSPVLFRMIFALMDGDGDGTVSLQEFQAAHERIFKAMDANKDGLLTQEEMQSFIHGAGRSVPQQ